MSLRRWELPFNGGLWRSMMDRMGWMDFAAAASTHPYLRLSQPTQKVRVPDRGPSVVRLTILKDGGATMANQLPRAGCDGGEDTD